MGTTVPAERRFDTLRLSQRAADRLIIGPILRARESIAMADSIRAHAGSFQSATGRESDWYAEMRPELGKTSLRRRREALSAERAPSVPASR